MSVIVKGYTYPVSERVDPVWKRIRRKRTVFGRITKQIDGKTFVFEQREDGLFVRHKWARTARRISFEVLATGQATFVL